MEKLISSANLRRSQSALPKYPAVKRDLAFTLVRELAAADIEAVIKKAGKPHLRVVELFDVYEGKQVQEGKKSMAYNLSFRSHDKTLTDDEVNQAMTQIIDLLAKTYQADIRS